MLRVGFSHGPQTSRGDTDDQVLLQHRAQPDEGSPLPGGDGTRLRTDTRGHAQG